MGMSNINYGHAGLLMQEYDSGIGGGRRNRPDDGKLGKGEFRDMFNDIFGRGGAAEAGRAFRNADLNGDNRIDQTELTAFMQQIQNEDMGRGLNSRNDKKDLLKKLLEMMGIPLDGDETLEELEDMLQNGCAPQGSGGAPGGCGGGSGGCGGGSGGGSGGGGCGGGGGGEDDYSPPPTPGPVYPPAVNDDAGGGSGSVMKRRELRASINEAAGGDKKLNRTEADSVFNYIDQQAAAAGSQSVLSTTERDQIFSQFAGGDGQMDNREQRKFTNYMLGGSGSGKMTIGDYNRVNQEYN